MQLTYTLPNQDTVRIDQCGTKLQFWYLPNARLGESKIPITILITFIYGNGRHRNERATGLYGVKSIYEAVMRELRAANGEDLQYFKQLCYMAIKLQSVGLQPRNAEYNSEPKKRKIALLFHGVSNKLRTIDNGLLDMQNVPSHGSNKRMFDTWKSTVRSCIDNHYIERERVHLYPKIILTEVQQQVAGKWLHPAPQHTTPEQQAAEQKLHAAHQEIRGLRQENERLRRDHQNRQDALIAIHNIAREQVGQ